MVLLRGIGKILVKIAYAGAETRKTARK